MTTINTTAQAKAEDARLPPLPNGYVSGPNMAPVFTAAQMREYALAAISKETKP